jgi:hypothetical protein
VPGAKHRATTLFDENAQHATIQLAQHAKEHRRHRAQEQPADEDGFSIERIDGDAVAMFNLRSTRTEVNPSRRESNTRSPPQSGVIRHGAIIAVVRGQMSPARARAVTRATMRSAVRGRNQSTSHSIQPQPTSV